MKLRRTASRAFIADWASGPGTGLHEAPMGIEGVGVDIVYDDIAQVQPRVESALRCFFEADSTYIDVLGAGVSAFEWMTVNICLPHERGWCWLALAVSCTF